MNSSGKVLTTFLVIMAILLVTLTAISIFFFQKEVEKREGLEVLLEASERTETRLKSKLEDAKKQSDLLVEKNKEADERINGLMDELELEEGLREELKIERNTLKKKFEKEKEDRLKVQMELEEKVKEFDEKVLEIEGKLKAEVIMKEDLEKQLLSYKEKMTGLEESLIKLEQEKVVMRKVDEPPKIEKPSQNIPPVVRKEEIEEEEVELDKIVVNPNLIPEGRILSVDTETGFVIVNIGEKDGVSMGNVMSVYRGKEYLGDIKVSRIQPEMAAADLIPPFSSRLVRKNDQVVVK